MPQLVCDVILMFRFRSSSGTCLPPACRGRDADRYGHRQAGPAERKS
jgi:hypothetical protein